MKKALIIVGLFLLLFVLYSLPYESNSRETRSKSIYKLVDILQGELVQKISATGAVEQPISRFYELASQIVAEDGSQQPIEPPGISEVTVAETADVDASSAIKRAAGGAQIVEERPDPMSRKDTLSQLQSMLEQAVICEEYEEAAHLRDQIERLVRETRA